MRTTKSGSTDVFRGSRERVRELMIISRRIPLKGKKPVST